MVRTLSLDAEFSTSTPGSWGDVLEIDLNTILPDPRVQSIKLLAAHVPLLLWNVQTDNQTLVLTVGGVPYTILIAPGNYDGPTLSMAITSAFNVAMTATTYTMTITIDSISNYATTTVTDSAIPGPAAFTLDPSPAVGDTPSIGELLGYDAGILSSIGATPLIATGPINLIMDRYILITCDEARGAFGHIHSTTPLDWHDGILAQQDIPPAAIVGTIINCDKGDTPITLSTPPIDGILHLRLSRTRHRLFGPQKVGWSVQVEVA